MASAIVDIQCVLAINYKYLIKELSVIDVYSSAVQHWIFKTPSELQNARSRSMNKWLFKNYHQLSEKCGDVEYGDLERIMKSLTYTTIYVKGKQKAQIIENYIPNVEVIDLQQLGCPRLNQLCGAWTTSSPTVSTCCIYHKDLNYTQCTFYRIFFLKQWLVNNS